MPVPAGAVESGVVYIAPVEPYGAVVQVFLDIDGVLLGLDRERPQRLALADHALDFLSFLLARATVHWLSPGHREAKAAVDHLLVHTRQSERERLLTLAPRVRMASWRTLRTEALPSDGRFLWLDDAPSPDELAALRQRGGSIAGSGSTPAKSSTTGSSPRPSPHQPHTRAVR